MDANGIGSADERNCLPLHRRNDEFMPSETTTGQSYRQVRLRKERYTNRHALPRRPPAASNLRPVVPTRLKLAVAVSDFSHHSAQTLELAEFD